MKAIICFHSVVEFIFVDHPWVNSFLTIILFKQLYKFLGFLAVFLLLDGLGDGEL